MHRAPSCNMCINQQDAQNSCDYTLFFNIRSTCFGLYQSTIRSVFHTLYIAFGICRCMPIRVAVVSPTHRPPLPPRDIPGTHFCQRLSRPQGHSAAGRIMSMKNSSDTNGNRTRDLTACSAVPQPIAPLPTPNRNEYQEYFLGVKAVGAQG